VVGGTALFAGAGLNAGFEALGINAAASAGEAIGSGEFVAGGAALVMTFAPIGRAGRAVKHHIFPKRFAEQFKGLVDIDQHTMEISEGLHRLIHGGGARGGRWNQAWEEFFENNPSFDAGDLYDQAMKMIRDFGIDGPMRRYR
jgi:hypothetical protein